MAKVFIDRKGAAVFIPATVILAAALLSPFLQGSWTLPLAAAMVASVIAMLACVGLSERYEFGDTGITVTGWRGRTGDTVPYRDITCAGIAGKGISIGYGDGGTLVIAPFEADAAMGMLREMCPGASFDPSDTSL